MAHLRPLEYQEITDNEVRNTIKGYEELRGFVPNSIRTMARRPSLAKAFMQLNKAVLYEGTVAESTKMMVFEDSDLFDEAEKAALNLAFKSAAMPCEAEQADFDRLAQHYDEAEIVEIVATISLFGYLNRWNDTMATQVELVPAQVTKRAMPDWHEGKHE